MSTERKIAIIGAGSVGGSLGATFARAGLTVTFGVRKDIPEALANAPGAKAASPNEAARSADVVFLAVPASAAVQVVRDLAKDLEGKVLVDCNNPLTWKEGPVWAPPHEGSLAAAIAAAAPGARVVKGFNTFGAEIHADPRKTGTPADVFYAGDDPEAKSVFAEIATRAGFHPIDAGPLRNAAVLENVAMLWIHLAMVGGHGRDFAFKAQRAP
jgi:8-hydroxy-5-deazaflavin:NADPH oxidoreductase